MTHKLYMFPDAPLNCAATVTEVNCAGDHPRIILDQTVFHVKGGGQLPDVGLLGSVSVIDVRHGPEGRVEHIVDDPGNLTPGDTVALSVNPEERLRNSRLHTAGHLIAGVMAKLYPNFAPLRAHHYPGECRVEFDGEEEAIPKLKTQLPAEVAHAAAMNLPVNVLGDPQVNRTIAIGDYPPVPCGGTHVQSTALIADIQITGIRMKDGRLRISYQV